MIICSQTSGLFLKTWLPTMHFSHWVTSPGAVYQIVQLLLEPQNTFHFLSFHICRSVLPDAEHLCSCSLIFSLYSHFSGWKSKVPYRVLSTSLTNTRLCSFIHIYILKIFYSGDCSYIIYSQIYRTSYSTEHGENWFFFFVLLLLLKVFSYFWSDEKRRRKILK